VGRIAQPPGAALFRALGSWTALTAKRPAANLRHFTKPSNTQTPAKTPSLSYHPSDRDSHLQTAATGSPHPAREYEDVSPRTHARPSAAAQLVLHAQIHPMRLFKKKNKETEVAAANPYAAPLKNDPYANAPPPAYQGGNDSFRREKTPAVTGQGTQFGGRGYQSAGSHGASGGYGGNQYGGGADQGAPRRTGGYGGLGNSDPNNEEERSALFGGAAQRQPKPSQQQPPQQAQQGGAYGQPGGSSFGESGVAGGGYGAPGGYGSGPAYDDRQLTAEEQEEEDISATKNEIKFMKQQDVSATRNALRMAQQAEETGRDTLARLGAQGGTFRLLPASAIVR
jgi:hypothetical protein